MTHAAVRFRHYRTASYVVHVERRDDGWYPRLTVIRCGAGFVSPAVGDTAAFRYPTTESNAWA